MALKPCRECKKDVSSEAKACPHCGVKDPTKKKTSLLAAVGYGLGGLVVIGMCSSALGRKTDGAKAASQPQAAAGDVAAAAVQEQQAVATTTAAPAQLVLTANEQTVLKVLLERSLESFASDGKGVFNEFSQSKAYVVTTADELQRAYEKNEVAADKQFKDRNLLVGGRVDSINRSIGENYYMKLTGGTNMFMSPHASMADGFSDWLAQVNKGEQVELACEGEGMLMGSAMLNECVPINVWAERTTAKLLGQVPDLVEAGNAPLTRIAAMAIGIAAAMPTSSCWTDATTCDKEAAAASKQLKKDPNIKSAVEARLPKADPTVFASIFK